MSVFVIMDGEYSDWDIKGYAETSDEAEKKLKEIEGK